MPVNELADQFPPAEIPVAPPTLAVGMPADLLRRLSDLVGAVRDVAAQSSRIGVAEADLYPRLSLNGFLGYAADDIERLFASKSFTAFIIPTVQWNVLNYGRIANNIAVQDARLQGAALQYQQTVLKAGGEVEDALVGFLKSQQQAALLEQSVRDAERSVELVLIQFKGGVVDFNRVYNTQSTLVTQQDQLAVARGEIALNLIRAYKALGGGWQHFFAGNGFPPVTSTIVESLPLVEPPQVEELPPTQPVPPTPQPSEPEEEPATESSPSGN
jgi:outer membrane protein TolC